MTNPEDKPADTPVEALKREIGVCLVPARQPWDYLGVDQGYAAHLRRSIEGLRVSEGPAAVAGLVAYFDDAYGKAMDNNPDDSRNASFPMEDVI